MEQLNDFADDRLITTCIYCGGIPDTRDHVPSRVLLDRPFPENLPIVGCCRTCNQGFSKDEEYLVCLIEAAMAGSTDPDKVTRQTVARTLRRSPALRNRIENARRQSGDTVEFAAELSRVANVMLKLARGHAAFELSLPCREPPDHFWFGPLASLPDGPRAAFNAAHIQRLVGEVGSRGVQRLMVVKICPAASDRDAASEIRMVLNGWVEVQAGNYRYLAVDDIDGIVIRVVVREFLACEAAWRLSRGKH